MKYLFIAIIPDPVCSRVKVYVRVTSISKIDVWISFIFNRSFWKQKINPKNITNILTKQQHENVNRNLQWTRFPERKALNSPRGFDMPLKSVNRSSVFPKVVNDLNLPAAFFYESNSYNTQSVKFYLHILNCFGQGSGMFSELSFFSHN